MVVDRLADKARGRFESCGRFSLTCPIQMAGQSVLLAKPQIYMNRSGLAVQELLAIHALEPARLLVVFDDMSLPLGRMRLRRGGGSSGQHGMQSVIDALAPDQIPRLRIGICPEDPPHDYAEYVLGDITPREQEVLDPVLDRAVEAVETMIADGLERAMNLHN
jgi:PTH1 family peptidyl-tRNA hydrolase